MSAYLFYNSALSPSCRTTAYRRPEFELAPRPTPLLRSFTPDEVEAEEAEAGDLEVREAEVEADDEEKADEEEELSDASTVLDEDDPVEKLKAMHPSVDFRNIEADSMFAMLHMLQARNYLEEHLRRPDIYRQYVEALQAFSVRRISYKSVVEIARRLLGDNSELFDEFLQFTRQAVPKTWPDEDKALPEDTAGAVSVAVDAPESQQRLPPMATWQSPEKKKGAYMPGPQFVKFALNPRSDVPTRHASLDNPFPLLNGGQSSMNEGRETRKRRLSIYDSIVAALPSPVATVKSFIHGLCGQGFVRPNGVKVHHFGHNGNEPHPTKGCWNAKGRPAEFRLAWDSHPSCQGKKKKFASRVPQNTHKRPRLDDSLPAKSIPEPEETSFPEAETELLEQAATILQSMSDHSNYDEDDRHYQHSAVRAGPEPRSAPLSPTIRLPPTFQARAYFGNEVVSDAETEEEDEEDATDPVFHPRSIVPVRAPNGRKRRDTTSTTTTVVRSLREQSVVTQGSVDDVDISVLKTAALGLRPRKPTK